MANILGFIIGLGVLAVILHPARIIPVVNAHL